MGINLRNQTAYDPKLVEEYRRQGGTITEGQPALADGSEAKPHLRRYVSAIRREWRKANK